MLFPDYVRRYYPTLHDSTGRLGIELDRFQPLFEISETQALNALEGAIEEQGEASYRSPTVARFIREHRRELQDLIELRDTLNRRLGAFSTKHRVSLKLDPSAKTIDAMVALGRSPRGTRRQPLRDMAPFAQYVIAAGYKPELRIRPSAAEDYEYGVLQPDGNIRVGKDTYGQPKFWAQAVFNAAVKRGTRENSVGNPWKAIQIHDTKDWITLDRAYKRLMSDEPDSDDDDEDDEME